MSQSPTAYGAALRWERLSPERSIKSPVRPPAYSAVLGARMFVALTDPNAATLLVAVGSDGDPAVVGPVPIATTGMCAATDHLVLTGLRARDGKAVVLELDVSGKIARELELPVAGALHRHPQPVCTTADVRIVWEEDGPGKASTLAWAVRSGAAVGSAHRHAWPERTVGFAAAPDSDGVALLRDGGYPRRAALYRITTSGVDAGVALLAPVVATPVSSADGTAVLVVPTPQTLQLAMVDADRVARSPTTLLTVAAPDAISGALLIALDRGRWAIAAASSGPDPSSSEALAGEPPRREEFALVAFDARSHAAGPAGKIGPPLAAAWLDDRLVLWTGCTSAAVATWRLVP